MLYYSNAKSKIGNKMNKQPFAIARSRFFLKHKTKV